MLSHTFLFTLNLHQPTTPSHYLSSLSFFHPPLHCTVAIPKYPWSTTIKSHPHLIFHTNLFFFATEGTKEINIQVQCRWVPFNFFFFFNFKPILFPWSICCSYLFLFVILGILQRQALSLHTIPSHPNLIWFYLCGWDGMGWDGIMEWFCKLWPYLIICYIRICDQEGCFGLLQLVELLKMCFELGFDDDW